MVGQIQTQKAEKERKFERDIQNLLEKLSQKSADYENQIGEITKKWEITKRESREQITKLQDLQIENENIKVQKGLAADQQSEHIERQNKQIQSLTKDLRDKDEQQSRL